MNYELALKLKNAGFPEITRISRELNLHRYISPNEPHVSYPFLQEILEQVSEEIILIKIDRNRYLAAEQQTYEDHIEYQHIENFQVFETPEEAVANLWLELNKK